MKFRFFLFCIVILLATLWFRSRPLQADDAVVGDGTPTSCTEAAFDTALATADTSGSGTITFNCGGPATIILTAYKVISASITIDGSNQITLSGGNSTRLFVNIGTLTLQNIILTNGFTISAHRGGAIVNTNILSLSNATIRDSTAGNGGGIVNGYGGITTLTNVTFSGNTANQDGGAIYNESSTVTLTNVNFSGNIASRDGGGIFSIGSIGSITLTDITLSDNSANDDGGAIYNESGTAMLTNVTLSGNSADYSGGGIFNTGTAALTNVTLSSNASDWGGGIFNIGGTAALTNVTLSGNSADDRGGGLYNHTGISTLTNVTLGSNASDLGGGIYNAGTAALTNVTLSGNSADYSGGGILNNGTAALTNVTFSGNSAVITGGGIYNNDLSSTYLTFRNSIIANSGSVDNCGGRAADEANFSLWSDNSCSFTAGSGNLPNTDPLLGPLANNGGLTLTHLPLPDSPAIDGGIATGAPTIDQRGLPRPYGPAHDIGAVEVQPANSLTYLYLPVVIKP